MTDALEDELEEMALSIFRCPRRNLSGRPLEQVRANCRHSVMDRALADLGGFQYNGGFDVTTASSYNHDARDGEVKFEVKTFKQSWFSWKRESVMATFLRHSRDIDYLVAGRLDESEPGFAGQFVLIARAPTFRRYVRTSSWGGWYYHHRLAAVDGEAAYLREIDQ